MACKRYKVTLYVDVLPYTPEAEVVHVVARTLEADKDCPVIVLYGETEPADDFEPEED